MMTPTSSRAMAASPWYHACCSWRKWSPTATTPSEPKTISDSRVGDAGGSEDTSVSTPKARYGRGSSPCSSRAIDDFPELEAPLRTITALRTPTTVAQMGPCPRANCFPAGPTAHGHARSCADLAQTWFSSFRNGILTRTRVSFRNAPSAVSALACTPERLGGCSPAHRLSSTSPTAPPSCTRHHRGTAIARVRRQRSVRSGVAGP